MYECLYEQKLLVKSSNLSILINITKSSETRINFEKIFFAFSTTKMTNKMKNDHDDYD